MSGIQIEGKEIKQKNKNKMERAIKFRVWNGMEMVYDVMVGKFGVFYVNPANNGVNVNDSACLTHANTKYPDDIPLMQYTGLKDKNGVEIYEGDIVDWVDSDYNIRCDIVRWINGGLVLCNNRYTVGSYPQIEVIANIYDNPELIEKI